MKFNELWINQLLNELEKKDDFSVLESCGAQCVSWSEMDEQIRQSNLSRASTCDELYQQLKKSPMNEHNLELHDDHIKMTYTMKTCVCPIMSQVEHPRACECTKGFLKQAVGLLSQTPLEVTIVDSYIRNNKPCSFKIKMI